MNCIFLLINPIFKLSRCLLNKFSHHFCSLSNLLAEWSIKTKTREGWLNLSWSLRVDWAYGPLEQALFRCDSTLPRQLQHYVWEWLSETVIKADSCLAGARQPTSFCNVSLAHWSSTAFVLSSRSTPHFQSGACRTYRCDPDHLEMLGCSAFTWKTFCLGNTVLDMSHPVTFCGDI